MLYKIQRNLLVNIIYFVKINGSQDLVILYLFDFITNLYTLKNQVLIDQAKNLEIILLL